MDIEILQKDILKKVIMPIVKEDMIDVETKFYINPTGRFVLGGAIADTGLTGRKIIVDTYGGVAHHGGGAYDFFIVLGCRDSNTSVQILSKAKKFGRKVRWTFRY